MPTSTTQDFESLAATRALAGIWLALGAPLGWLSVEYLFNGVSPMESIQANPVLYTYLTFATMAAFGFLGFSLGRMEERLAKSNRDILAAKKQIESSSRTDLTTGFYNAAGFLELLRKSPALHNNDPSASLIVLGCYRKAQNEASSEESIRLISRTIKLGRRREDVLARIGNFEFAVFLPNIDAEEACKLAQELLTECGHLASRNQLEAYEFYAGVTRLVPHDDARKLIERAEKAMQSAKLRFATDPVRSTESEEELKRTG